MQILDAPHHEVQKAAKNLTLHFHAQHCLYPNLFLNLPHLYQTKNHQIPQRICHFCLQRLKLWRHPHVSCSFFRLLFDAAIFIALDHRAYSVWNNCRGWQWLPRRRWLVMPHRGKHVDYVTVVIPTSYLVILKRY